MRGVTVNSQWQQATSQSHNFQIQRLKDIVDTMSIQRMQIQRRKVRHRYNVKLMYAKSAVKRRY